MSDRNVRIDGLVEVKGASGLSLNPQPARVVAITIANKVIYPVKGFVYVGVSGDVAVIPADNADAKSADPTGWIIFKGFPQGQFIPIPVIRIGDIGAGTSATDLVFCY